MPKSLKKIKETVLNDNSEIRPEDIDYVLGERLGYTPSEFELHINDELTPEQEKQALKDMRNFSAIYFGIRLVLWLQNFS